MEQENKPFRNPEKQEKLALEARARGFIPGTKYKDKGVGGNVQTIGGVNHKEVKFTYCGPTLMDKTEFLTDGNCGKCWVDDEWADIVEYSPQLSIFEIFKIKKEFEWK